VDVVLNPSYEWLFSATDIFYDLRLSRAYVSSAVLFSKYGFIVDGFTLMPYIYIYIYIRIGKEQGKMSTLPVRMYRSVRHLIMSLGGPYIVAGTE